MSPKSDRPDVCLIFGYQNPSQYYYAHICNRAVGQSHAIHVVDGQPRIRITEKRSPGVVWGGKWHHVRLVRVWSTGWIKVYFDDMKEPILTARERRFDLGRIGVGSFDDLACFDDIIVRGQLREELRPVNPAYIPPVLKRPRPPRAPLPASRPSTPGRGKPAKGPPAGDD